MPLDSAPSPSLHIDLSPVELEIAAMVGVKRMVENLFKERKDKHGADPEKGWSWHIEGAAGEMAVARLANRYWSGNIGDLKAGDVGRAQVRTARRHTDRLRLHHDDHDDAAFILVTGLAPHFVVRGWMFARDGKREEWWCDPTGDNRPAFFVPQSALRPMQRKET